MSKRLGFHFTMHTFRRSLASLLVKQGAPLADVRDQLGHSSMKTTESYYVARGSSAGERARRIAFGFKADEGKNGQAEERAG
ncbi:site-specific integrase [Planctomycetota bacterium]